jgi:hypothetical protein
VANDPPPAGTCGRITDPERTINYPASPNVGSRLAKMTQDVSVRAAGFLQGVGKHAEPDGVEFARWQRTLFVGDCCEPGHGRGEPGRVKGDEAEGVAEDVMEQTALRCALRDHGSADILL